MVRTALQRVRLSRILLLGSPMQSATGVPVLRCRRQTRLWTTLVYDLVLMVFASLSLWPVSTLLWTLKWPTFLVSLCRTRGAQQNLAVTMAFPAGRDERARGTRLMVYDVHVVLWHVLLVCVTHVTGPSRPQGCVNLRR